MLETTTGSKSDGRNRLALSLAHRPALAAPSRSGWADGYDIIAVGRRRNRLDELVAALPNVKVLPMVADLATDADVEAVAAVCASQQLTMLVNNAGVAHYMSFIDLPADKASELLRVKVPCAEHAVPSGGTRMVARGEGTIINVSGMLAFSGPATVEKLPLRRAIDAAALAQIVTLSQALHEELPFPQASEKFLIQIEQNQTATSRLRGPAGRLLCSSRLRNRGLCATHADSGSAVAGRIPQ